MKKKLILIICILFLLFLPLSYKYKIYKNKDLNYVVEQHMTHGLFNKYKMHSINSLNLTFSDGNIAVVKVYGTSNSSPHKSISYNLFLTKSKNGAWKVKKYLRITSIQKKKLQMRLNAFSLLYNYILHSFHIHLLFLNDDQY